MDDNRIALEQLFVSKMLIHLRCQANGFLF